jgi:CRP/FNR family cyclic AMP-dependent transcriptional regulator
VTKSPIMFAAIKGESSFDPEPFFVRAGDRRSISRYRKDQIVFSQGDPADAVFYIQGGMVRVTIHSEQGKKAVVAFLGTGDFFGEECLARQLRRVATVAAMTNCSISRLGTVAAIRLFHDEPKFSELFIAYLSARKLQTDADLVDQLLNSSEKRLARRLLLLADSGKKGPPKPAMVRINQDTLAAMIGTTQARVSFFMNKFQRLGFIDYKSELKIRSSLLNAVLND